tara:strand:- start:423 stop:1199 length:777 start_codon:yes stop_codon:yes gene_type:complete
MLTTVDLFAGLGGFSQGLSICGGFKTVAFCEQDEFCQAVLEKHWPGVPIYPDVRELSGEQLAGADIICSGFPCQDLSIAGNKLGLEGKRSGLWGEAVRLIGEIRPRYAIVENVTNLLAGPNSRRGEWFGIVLGDLAQIGFDAEWHSIQAAEVGAPTERERVWIIAYPSSARLQGPILDGESFCKSNKKTRTKFGNRIVSCGAGWPELGPYFRVGDGLSSWSHEIKALGNSICPPIVAEIGKAILNAEESDSAQADFTK